MVAFTAARPVQRRFPRSNHCLKCWLISKCLMQSFRSMTFQKTSHWRCLHCSLVTRCNVRTTMMHVRTWITFAVGSKARVKLRAWRSRCRRTKLLAWVMYTRDNLPVRSTLKIRNSPPTKTSSTNCCAMIRTPALRRVSFRQK